MHIGLEADLPDFRMIANQAGNPRPGPLGGLYPVRERSGGPGHASIVARRREIIVAALVIRLPFFVRGTRQPRQEMASV